MESWQARFESFSKGKRVKKGSSTTVLKWPHPPSFEANPESLAEAGFYYTPSLNNADAVTCFICDKSLSDWEETDDPFAEHVRRGDACCWAIARCALRSDMDEDGNFTFPDPSRLPSSKLLEKARLELYGTSWPHDAVKGHTANSKKMAKAGFVYTPQGPGDDTVTCFYCQTSLSGWDDGDDPLEEHRKREQKSGEPCPFFASRSSTQPSKPSSRPSSRTQTKPPSKSAAKSKTRSKHIEDEALSPESSPDELDPFAPTRSRASTTKKSMSNRASSVPTKTPASRMSTRSAGTKASMSRGTAGSEVEEEPEASGSDTGKRVSKTKRKGQTKMKERIEAIQEEEEVVDMPEEEPAPPVPAKPKRGRPPGKKTAAAKGRAKKVPVVEEVMIEESEEEDARPAKKLAHSRTQLKAEGESDSDIPVASSSKDAKAKSSTKSKAKPMPVVEVPMPPRPPSRSAKANGKKAHQEPEYDQEAEDDFAHTEPLREATAVSKAKTKTHVVVEESEDEVMGEPQDAPPDTLPPPAKKPTQPVREFQVPEAPKGKTRKSSSTSDDAGYATAEYAMDVDAHPAAQRQPKPMSVMAASTAASFLKRSQPEPNFALPTNSQQSRPVHRGSSIEPVAKPPSRQGSVRPLSRTSSLRASSLRPGGSLARVPSRMGTEIVDISSSDEDDVPVEKSKSVKKPTAAPTSSQPDSLSHPEGATHADVPEDMDLDEETAQKPAPKVLPPVKVKAERTVKTAQKKLQDEVVVSSPQIQPMVPTALPDVEMSEPEADTADHQTDIPAEPAAESPVDKAPSPRHSPATPPPRTPSVALTETEMPKPDGKSVAPGLPSFDEDMEMEVNAAQPPADGDDAFGSFIPFLSMVPLQKLTSLTEEECDMTVEQYIRREMERQQQQFKEDAERKIALFKEKAAETRKIIESA